MSSDDAAIFNDLKDIDRHALVITQARDDTERNNLYHII